MMSNLAKLYSRVLNTVGAIVQLCFRIQRNQSKTVIQLKPLYQILFSYLIVTLKPNQKYVNYCFQLFLVVFL